MIKKWLLTVWHDGRFKKFFGFSKETFDNDLWPAMFCLRGIKEKMQVRSPKLMKMKDSEGNLVETELCHQLMRMFETQREKRRIALRLPQKLAGKKKGTMF